MATKTASAAKLAKPTKGAISVSTKSGRTKQKKDGVDLVKKYRSHKNDTGSIEVQVALFSEKINQLAKHLKKHHKDNDSKRGLLQMIGKRRRLLNYLKKRNEKKYLALIKDLGLRK